MERICIAKRRRPIQSTDLPVPEKAAHSDHSPFLSIELSAQQAEAIRANTHFQRLHADRNAPIFLNLHFGNELSVRMLKPKEICVMLQVSRHTLDRLVVTGCLKSYRIGRLRRFSVEDVMEYLAGGLHSGRLRNIRVDIAGMAGRESEAPAR
jgi:excisionase family DNA binding protein